MATEKGTKGPTIANAVVAVIPSFEGARQKIGSEIPDMVVPASEKAGSEGGKKLGNKLSEGITTAKVAIGNAIGNVLTSALNSASNLIKNTLSTAFNNYGDYQQLVGGVETLFKGSAGAVQQYAKNAYKTAGLSANEYMETVTSFSGALLRTLGDDTETATKLADMAIGDMADQANKYGTSIDMVKGTYLSLARGGYAMLDNLFGGMFAGTKTGLRDMLNYAQKFRASLGETVEYSENSYADIVSAIHDVSVSLGVYGTTSKEASETITGSINMAKSAWQNFLTGLGNPDANMKDLTANLTESVATAFKNVMPAIQNIAKTTFSMAGDAMTNMGLGWLVDGITKLWSLISKYGGLVVDFLTTNVLPNVSGFFSSIGDFLNAFYEAAKAVVQPLVDAFAPFVSDVLQELGKLKPDIGIVEDLGKAIKDCFGWVKDHGEEISAALVAIGTGLAVFKVASLISTVASALKAFSAATTIAAAAQWAMNIAMEANPIVIIITLIAALIAGLVYFFTQTELGQKIWGDFCDFIGPVFEEATQAIGEALEALKPIFDAAGQAVADLIPQIVDVLKKVAKTVIEVTRAIIQGFNKFIKWLNEDEMGKLVKQVFEGIVEIVKGAFNIILGILQISGGLIIGIVTGDWSMLADGVQSIVDGLADVIAGIWNTITAYISMAVRNIYNNAVMAFGAIVEFVKGIPAAIVGFFQSLPQILGTIFNWVKDRVIEAGQALLDFFIHLPERIVWVFQNLPQVIGMVFNWVKDRVIEAGQAILAFFSKIPREIIGFFWVIPDALAAIFKSIHVPTLHVKGQWNLDPEHFSIPQIEFYAKGGWVDTASIINVAGERGTEAVLANPRHSTFTRNFADAVAGYLDRRGGDTYFVIDGAVINSDEEMKRNFYENMMEIKRKAAQYA